MTPCPFKAYLMEWSSSTFDDYELTTSEVYVSCSGNDGTANGTFRLMLDTSDSDYAAVQVNLVRLGDVVEIDLNKST